MVKSIFLKFLLVAVGLLIVVAVLFCDQIRTMVPDWLMGDVSGQPTLSDSDLAFVRDVKLMDPSTPIAKVSVTNLSVISHSGADATIGMTLSSSAPETRYPSLRIFLRSGERVVRTIELKPTEYGHGRILLSEKIQIPIALRSGETGFTVQAHYESAGGTE
ncbi:hypothetical protein DBB29_24845 [Pandoraea cepalis]|uniref:Uncharacterized protein n=1 Tax=Pandoraea cepalis TaxID=2508294 RepID=A0AAW7MGW7_9BURK|nr:hypothetical protein [Pandoraea cepalis]MDN4571890.1 hypothetical protein [Pandoraea cepalis]MDN4581344.1 hypothetical protein [Pandoraea cepalis]